MFPSMNNLKEYEAWKKKELAAHIQTAPQNLIGKQWLPETDFTHYKKYYDAILGYSLESKKNGDILWGRVQGTESEKKTLLFVKESLEKAGLDEVIYEEFPCYEKQWKPTRCALSIKTGTDMIKLETCMTAFQSGQTCEEGLEAEIIFVGEGSESELAGRDLTGKIVLLSAHCYPNALLHSGRKAFSRLAERGAVGAIIWWQLPGNLPVAGRVGTPMGGDHKGAALPWISIARTEGVLIRSLLDKGIVKGHLTVTGEMEERQSGHVMGWLKGKTDKIILITMHVDGYFYAMHDNGAGVAMGLESARLFAEKTIAEREYTMLFHFSGDHEVPGAGGTRILAKRRDIMNRVIVAYQIEHVFSKQYIDESGVATFTNVQNAQFIFVSGKQKNLTPLFHEAAEIYGTPVVNAVLADPTGDIQGFYPPFAPDSSLLCAGFIEGTPFYHSTADSADFGLLCDEGLARAFRAYHYVFECSQKKDLQFFAYDSAQLPEPHMFTSPYFACLYNEF